MWLGDQASFRVTSLLVVYGAPHKASTNQAARVDKLQQLSSTLASSCSSKGFSPGYTMSSNERGKALGSLYTSRSASQKLHFIFKCSSTSANVSLTPETASSPST